MINKVIDYLKKVYMEMRKVTWPTRKELTNSTIVVIIISAIVALIIFVLDTIFSNVLRLFLS
ncbi:MAG TPA: preprotein translocase subunit SecE [candidate division WOR-3 bacterium]|uniref:Protein translocase subunit SecE n=1 Tax=candidate division WOR-3 bacterium TaxID=2052148 RepID=A0A9C9K0A6_UNCW3|nr:preprotein translocase subunit SecE [candidate division WOR-3 bacterium]